MRTLQSMGKEGICMLLTVDTFIGILSLCLGAFALGYAIGCASNKTQK